MSKTAGPRAIRNQERYIQEALQQKEHEHELELSNKQQSCIICYESTASAAQKYAYEQKIIMAKERNKADCFHNHTSDEDGNDFDNHAISFWSYHLLGHSKHQQEKDKANSNNDLTSLMKRTSFAKCTSFTNDIRDGRLNHASN